MVGAESLEGHLVAIMGSIKGVGGVEENNDDQ
jgi:hypothetical protein